MAGPLIITAEIAPSDLAWLDRLRRSHYPAERNQLPAHLTLFHALPPSAEAEVRSTLARLARQRPPRASIGGAIDLGGGVAMRVVSEELDQIRADLAMDFHGLLSAQDALGWRPHITIQNKVASKEARSLKALIDRVFRRCPIGVSGLGLHQYLGGPWKLLALYQFRGR